MGFVCCHGQGKEQDMKKLILRYIGRDSFSRPVYEADGKLYVDVDPREGWAPKIFTKYGNRFDGEPDLPVRDDTILEFIPERDLWDKKRSPGESRTRDQEETLPARFAPEKGRLVIKVTLYQVIPEQDGGHLLFADLYKIRRLCGGRVPAENYGVAYSGELEISTPEEAYAVFNMSRPEGYTGRSMSVSDVLEFTDREGRSVFYFCNPVGFEEIRFDSGKAAKNMVKDVNKQ